MKLLNKVVSGVSSVVAKMRDLGRAVVVSGVAAISAAPLVSRAQASGVDFTSLSSQVDFTTTITAVMAVAGALVLLYVAIKGAKIVLRMIRGA